MRNEKGFSLVEVIVVVLILGIIAVALAPQVMKWVQISKEKRDDYSRKSIKAAALIAIGEYESNGNVLKDSKYDVKAGGIAPVGTDANNGLITVLQTCMSEEYPEVISVSGKVFQIQFWQNEKKVDVVIVAGTY